MEGMAGSGGADAGQVLSRAPGLGMLSMAPSWVGPALSAPWSLCDHGGQGRQRWSVGGSMNGGACTPSHSNKSARYNAGGGGTISYMEGGVLAEQDRCSSGLLPSCPLWECLMPPSWRRHS